MLWRVGSSEGEPAPGLRSTEHLASGRRPVEESADRREPVWIRPTGLTPEPDCGRRDYLLNRTGHFHLLTTILQNVLTRGFLMVWYALGTGTVTEDV